MKQKIIIIAGVVLLIVGVFATLPFIYKDSLLAKVKTTLNNQVNAKIDFSDFKLSVFSQFPKVEMQLNKLSLVGINEFANDTILSVSSISTNISLLDLISNKSLELKSLTINNPKISLLVSKSGAVNWDIAKTQDSSKKKAVDQEAGSDAGFKMKLNDIQVNNLNLLYDDQAMPMKILVKNSNLKSSGDVSGTITDFDLSAEVGEFIFDYDSVQYISKTKLKAETKLKVDSEKMNFAFDQARLLVNNLPLEINGSFAMPNDSMLFDVAFKSEKSDFATILALVPADYQQHITKAKIDGAAAFKGMVKGLYYKEVYPAIDVLLEVNNGSFKYQNLPESVENIQVLAQISKPEGCLNLMTVEVKKAHASVRNNPVDMSLSLSELMTDPTINASFSGTIDFVSLKQAIPVDSLDITGILKAKMQLAGRMSSIEKQEYEKFQSNGEATIQNFRIESNRLTKAVEISQGQLKANTKQIIIEKFDGKIGQSDFSLSGNVSNYLAYVFRNEVLKGNFNLKSSFMNFSELSNIQKPDKKGVSTDVKAAPIAPNDSVVAFQIPEKLDLSFQSVLKQAMYDKMPISNIVGLVRVKDQRMELSNLSMEMLKGKLAVNGSYTSNKENKPLFDFKLNMENIDFPTAAQSLSTIQRYVPIASKSQGTFSTQFALSGIMSPKMKIIPASLNGVGVFTTQNVIIVDSPVFDQIRGIIKKDKLKTVKIDDFTAKFQIENGRLNLNPFKTTIAEQQTTIYGSLSATREINMNMDFVVNRDVFGTDINKGLDILPGSQNIKMIDASVILKGSLSKPEVSLDLSKARKQIEQEVKKASIDEIKGSVKKLGDELKKLFK